MKALASNLSVEQSPENLSKLSSKPSSNKGFTLIESIFTIAIIAIAMTGLIAVWSKSVARSADPYWQTQVAALGKIYLAQVSQQDFAKLQDYVSSTNLQPKSLIEHFSQFNVQLSLVNAGADFNLADKALKKVSIIIKGPAGSEQQFVTYRGDY
jgi:prepilin-type N-terminal cleavage/methylation domain-containing protein